MPFANSVFDVAECLQEFSIAGSLAKAQDILQFLYSNAIRMQILPVKPVRQRQGRFKCQRRSGGLRACRDRITALLLLFAKRFLEPPINSLQRRAHLLSFLGCDRVQLLRFFAPSVSKVLQQANGAGLLAVSLNCRYIANENIHVAYATGFPAEPG
jgi:hypothetical protein